MNQSHSKCLPLELMATGCNINKNIAITQHPRSRPLGYHHHCQLGAAALFNRNAIEFGRNKTFAYYKPALHICHSEATLTFGSLGGASNSECHSKKKHCCRIS